LATALHGDIARAATSAKNSPISDGFLPIKPLYLAARYAFVEKSILVVTEGLGPRKFHGRVVLMVNEHTASTGEMMSAFSEENNCAVIIGTKTPGRLLSASAFKVGHDYILGLPIAAYLKWQGRMLENHGILPNFAVEPLARCLDGCARYAARNGNSGGESLVMRTSVTDFRILEFRIPDQSVRCSGNRKFRPSASHGTP
jgi:Peptidase family S41